MNSSPLIAAASVERGADLGLLTIRRRLSPCVFPMALPPPGPMPD